MHARPPGWRRCADAAEGARSTGWARRDSLIAIERAARRRAGARRGGASLEARSALLDAADAQVSDSPRRNRARLLERGDDPRAVTQAASRARGEIFGQSEIDRCCSRRRAHEARKSIARRAVIRAQDASRLHGVVLLTPGGHERGGLTARTQQPPSRKGAASARCCARAAALDRTARRQAAAPLRGSEGFLAISAGSKSRSEDAAQRTKSTRSEQQGFGQWRAHIARPAAVEKIVVRRDRSRSTLLIRWTRCARSRSGGAEWRERRRREEVRAAEVVWPTASWKRRCRAANGRGIDDEDTHRSQQHGADARDRDGILKERSAGE